MATKKAATKKSVPVAPSNDWEREYKIRNAADTLLQAGAIQQDKALMSEVKKELQKRKKAIDKVTKR